MTINIGSAVGCLAVAGAVGIGVWKNVGRGANVIQSEGQLASDGKDFFGAGDTIIGVGDRNVLWTGSDVSAENLPYIVDSDSDSGTAGVTEKVPVTSAPESGASASSAGENLPHFATSSSDDGNSSECTPAGYGITIDRMPEVPLTGSHDAPENGTLVFSEPLKAALEKYGDTDGGDGSYWYQVRVEFYKDGKPVDVNSPEIREVEWERLRDKNFALIMENITNDRNESAKCRLSLLAPKKSLDNFEVNGEYGYFMKLYFEDDPEEYYAPESEPVVYNGC